MKLERYTPPKEYIELAKSISKLEHNLWESRRLLQRMEKSISTIHCTEYKLKEGTEVIYRGRKWTFVGFVMYPLPDGKIENGYYIKAKLMQGKVKQRHQYAYVSDIVIGKK